MGPYSEYTGEAVGERERLPEIAFLFDPPEPLKVACSMQCALQSLQTAAHCCRGHEARTETVAHTGGDIFHREFSKKAKNIMENNTY